jgi:hypothetical protein
VTSDCILAAMSETASIWSISSSNPHNDFIKRTEQLSEFRCIARRLFDETKAVYGNKAVLHVTYGGKFQDLKGVYLLEIIGRGERI